MSPPVLISLAFLLAASAVCAWLWREPLRSLWQRVRGPDGVDQDRGCVPLDDQPAWLIADLARRLSQNPPLT